MTVFLRKATAFWNDESGVTAIEYGLIAALIVVGLAAILGPIGQALETAFTTIQTDLSTATGGGGE